ncbi:hypothetical protein [Bifidobacterium biavatii]|uniref:hypothetical protein n=1 Tax=Bifidobacterium biavatii TaxID=762212 RepID=UPI001269A58C|nr:hypothetical protein [Bifidobacterium biavatii]
MVAYAADPYLPYGSKTGTINVKNYSDKYNDQWISIIDNGISAWNNSRANVAISTKLFSNNSIEAARYDATWYGLTTQTYNTSTGYTSKFVVQVNAKTISADASDFANFAKSTVTHEFGHVFWLVDNPSTAQSSIMKYSRNRNIMTTPQTFDINNVNAKYGG